MSHFIHSKESMKMTEINIDRERDSERVMKNNMKDTAHPQIDRQTYRQQDVKIQ